MLIQSAEVHSGNSQAPRVNLFVRKINGFKLTLLTILAKSSVVDD